jgi:hypothetical protein
MRDDGHDSCAVTACCFASLLALVAFVRRFLRTAVARFCSEVLRRDATGRNSNSHAAHRHPYLDGWLVTGARCGLGAGGLPQACERLAFPAADTGR